MRLAGAVERDGRVDDGRDGAVVEEGGQRLDPWRQRAAVVPQALHVDPDERLRLAHLLEQVEAAHHPQRLRQRAAQVARLALLDRRGAEGDEAAAGAQQPVGALERGAADAVDDEVVARQIAPPAVAAVVDGAVEAELAQPFVLAGRRRAVDLGPAALGELQRGDADAAGGGVDENALARAQRAVAVERRPRRGVDDRHRRALLEGQALGQRHRVALGHHDLRGVAAEAVPAMTRSSTRPASTPSPTAPTVPATS